MDSYLEHCAVCGAEEFIPYVCRYCGNSHCVLHRLPENHECANIAQARAPKPLIRVEGKTLGSTLRLFKTSRFARLSTRELRALLIAWLVLGLAFSVRFFTPARDPVTIATLFLLTLVIVGTGFLGHELAHKFSAQHYGLWAEFKLWTQGAIMALLFALVSSAFGGFFVFAAPGAVYIASRASYFGEGLDKKTNGIVSAMGPIVNFGAAAVFLLAFLVTLAAGLEPSGIARWFLVEGLRINLWLGAFNLLPLFVLDGQKVYAWDKRIWAIVTIPSWAAFFATLML